MKISIIKYNSGNVQSVQFALERIGLKASVTDDPEDIRSSDKIIFPGVGEAGTAMDYLKSQKLDVLIRSLEQPVLGICLGMQLMCKHSEESDTNCLGVFDIAVKKFNGNHKIPHMGWNHLSEMKTSLFNGINDDVFMYYVHSYFAELSDYTIAKTNYGITYSAALNKNNFYGVQFHPEKSSVQGQLLIENFIKL
jgi:glutamine amidotransferase